MFRFSQGCNLVLFWWGLWYRSLVGRCSSFRIVGNPGPRYEPGISWIRISNPFQNSLSAPSIDSSVNWDTLHTHTDTSEALVTMETHLTGFPIVPCSTRHCIYFSEAIRRNKSFSEVLSALSRAFSNVIWDKCQCFSSHALRIRSFVYRRVFRRVLKITESD